ncbi:MAG: hypothetical protein B7X95_09630 [Methylophilaceae bacterium 17-44-8]|jgi:hypothetical protein|nr:MAG: hypothetical protein B7Y48_10015 [Methylophilales bacterium 28-44-11]OZA04587.1 MAG: hypothetical protein B7X95_09630 [Methylophilaceae bacterium 17-44-8]
MFEALFLLFLKHFVCDFPLQISPWMYRNKGIYLHLGGVAHAAIHAAGTWLVLVFFIGHQALLYALIDFVAHYHIDWAKLRINMRLDWRPDNSNGFWILLGFDQLLHHITYFVIIYYAFNYQFT